MGPKLLFLLGIVVTHGAVGAALLREDTPQVRPISGCAPSPDTTPYFSQPSELLAMHVVPIDAAGKARLP